jgi:hypothetical protein
MSTEVIIEDTAFKPRSIYNVIVDRLLRVYDPLDALRLPDIEEVKNLVSKAVPEAFYAHHGARDPDYDVGRIRYFVDVLRADGFMDPIKINNDWAMNKFAGVVLVDGHHRLLGAYFAGAETIPAQYAGIVNVLDWLTGDLE